MSLNNTLNFWEQPIKSASGLLDDNALNIMGSFFSNKISQVLVQVVTLAQSNAGLTIIPALAGRTITVTEFQAKVSGAYTTNTAILVQDTNGTPVVVATLAQVGLTNGAILSINSANVTAGAGYLAPLTAGKGLAIANSGTAAAGGTSITFRIGYFIS